MTLTFESVSIILAIWAASVGGIAIMVSGYAICRVWSLENSTHTLIQKPAAFDGFSGSEFDDILDDDLELRAQKQIQKELAKAEVRYLGLHEEDLE